MKHIFHHLFLPHWSNNHKARLLHQPTMLLLVAILLFQSLVFSRVRSSYPQVLGSKVTISAQDLLQLTNKERKAHGEDPLVLNDNLTKAAQSKANYMFAHNFWAHNAPDGKTPWDFIKGSQYSYIYAGENLARGFSTTNDVVSAWMASPDHRENMLSPNYLDVGFAIEQGNLTGEKDTTLVVELFGSTVVPPHADNTDKTPIAEKEQKPELLAAIDKQPSVNSQELSRIIGLGLIGLFILVLILDIIIIKKKQIVRLFEHNLDHVMYLSFILALIGIMGKGVIY